MERAWLAFVFIPICWALPFESENWQILEARIHNLEEESKNFSNLLLKNYPKINSTA